MVTKKITNTRKKTSTHHTKKGFAFVAVGVLLLVFISGILGYQIHSWQTRQSAAPDKDRLGRITTIYKNLTLGSDYQLVHADVFGDKRVYEWDQGRTYSSAQTYTRGASVNVTVAELRQKIEAAGFTYFEEPYPGSANIELHFTSPKKEYIRLSVSSKPRDDALRNDAIMGNQLSTTALNLDPNAGPSTVTIKVNLDDNNE
jgi:hypothetical protein